MFFIIKNLYHHFHGCMTSLTHPCNDNKLISHIPVILVISESVRHELISKYVHRFLNLFSRILINLFNIQAVYKIGLKYSTYEYTKYSNSQKYREIRRIKILGFKVFSNNRWIACADLSTCKQLSP